MAWHRTIVEKSLFVIVFVIVATLGIAHMLGMSGNDLLETTVNAVISTAVAFLIARIVFWQERRRVKPRS